MRTTPDLQHVTSAIIAGDTAAVVDLLSVPDLGSIRDQHGNPLLLWCCHHGDVTAVRLLLSRGASLEHIGPDLGLLGACFHGHVDLTRFLLGAGADVRHVDPTTGETPLHAALCKADRPTCDRIVELVLDAGADPNARTIPGIATDAFMRDVRTRGESPLHRAAAFASEATIARLIARGGDRELRDSNGDSPLTWASWHLRPRSVLGLLCYGEHRIRQ